MVCMSSISCTPPNVRPSVKHDHQQRSEDDISHIIVNIIKANSAQKKKLLKIQSKVIEDWTLYCNIILLP